ncbi:Hypothetical predicted protein [Mytilus galloprovincialis]|uniref:Uncharacterized protein n=1 Tax=Mytilus galloprovincialis TaxID=29158 RepID=A0A8B6GK51_MYTGA|nr:Hypothetical predicted protein [Mytilus galloprovincialis]
MPRLRQNERDRAVGMVQAGMRHIDVANNFGVFKLTITRLMSSLSQTGSSNDRRRSGHPRETTLRHDRRIRFTHLRDQFFPATIPQHNHRGDIIQGYPPKLYQIGLDRLVTQCHFSDEFRFRLRRSDGTMRVNRRQNERYADACVHECDRFGGGDVMVWAGITHCGRIDLKFINGSLIGIRYRDEILSPIVQQFIARHGNRYTFSTGQAMGHVARVCTQYIGQNNIDILPWPGLSPDLSPIEHLWD